MKTKGLVLALSLAVFFSLSSVQYGLSAPVEIRFQSMHLSYEPMATALKQIITDFEKDNPGIRVVPEPTSELDRHTKFVSQMEAGVGPDVISIGPGFVRPYWEAKYLIGLDAFVQAEGGKKYLDQFLDTAVQQCTWGGKLVGIPHWGGAEGILLYNKRLFREAGLDPTKPPKTWEQFREYAKRLTKDINGDGKIDQWGYAFRSARNEGTTEILRTWLWANGADILDAKETKAVINSPQAVTAITFLTNLALVDAVVPPSFTNIRGDEIATLFAEGKVAMYYDGPWAPGSAIAHNPAIKDDIGIAPPMAKRYCASPSIFVANGITRDSKNAEAAWRFITYISNKKSNIIYARASGFQPMRKDVQPGEISDDPLMMAFADYLVKYGRMIQQFPHKSEIDIIVATALQEILLKTKSPKKSLDDAAAKINALLKK